MTSNTREPEPFMTLYAVSKETALIPAIAYSEQAGGYVTLPPVVKCRIDDPKVLAKELQRRLTSPVIQSEMSFEEAKTGSTIQNALNLKSMKDVEKQTVYLTLAIEDGQFDLQIFGRSSRGTWLDAPYALDVKIPCEEGFESLANTIVGHLQGRQDLSANVSSSMA